MSQLRDKFQAKFKNRYGSSPPSWTGEGLGTADANPSYIARGLGIDRYRSSGEDWLDDVYQILNLALRSQILNGLYSNLRKVGNNEIQLLMANDVAAVYAPSRRMILSTLWAAEKLGLIAMPQKLKVETSGNVVRVYW